MVCILDSLGEYLKNSKSQTISGKLNQNLWGLGDGYWCYLSSPSNAYVQELGTTFLVPGSAIVVPSQIKIKIYIALQGES